MSTNGSQPRPVGWRMPGSRRVRLAVGVATGLVIAGVLVVPVVLLGTGSKAPPCSATISYKGGRYLPRQSGRVVEAIAIGVGVATGCGQKPANVDLRSVQGVSSVLAVVIASNPSTIYVRRGVCRGKQDRGLIRCLGG